MIDLQAAGLTALIIVVALFATGILSVTRNELDEEDKKAVRWYNPFTWIKISFVVKD